MSTVDVLLYAVAEIQAGGWRIWRCPPLQRLGLGPSRPKGSGQAWNVHV